MGQSGGGAGASLFRQTCKMPGILKGSSFSAGAASNGGKGGVAGCCLRLRLANCID